MLRSLVLIGPLVAAAPAMAQWPANFTASPISEGWEQPVGLTFAADGRMMVWEKGGRVWTVENGVKSAAPLLDLSEEVGDWRDHGLLGFALDPNFLANGYLYASYVVDWHHLEYFGTPQYSASANHYLRDTIGRIVRYTANSSDGFRSVNYASRLILVGESKTTGIPICHQSHGVGALAFGGDGSLLASTGDGAGFFEVDVGQPIGGSSNTALAEGILAPKEAIGAWRSQLVDSLSGKVLRLDPANGNGLPNNPFYDPAAPRAARSRVWALGLRNPFRFVRIPGTGHAHGNHTHPGVLLLGDVGWNTHEELSTCDAPAQNFGWPLFEGLVVQPGYAATNIDNLDAPNPLAGGSCGPFLRFQDLLVQDVPGAPSWPNPCDPLQQVPPTLARFEHVRPWLEYGHGFPPRTGIFTGGQADRVEIFDPASPLQGPYFGGACPGALTWCTSTSYPAVWRNTLFIADYVAGWVKSVQFDANHQPLVVRNFGADGGAGAVVAMATHPHSGDVYFIDYGQGGASSVRHLRWTDNAPPTAVASPAQSFGPTPLTVQFSSAGSSDPEGLALSYLWDFGDGTTSTAPNPTKVFDALDDVTAQGQILARVFELTPPGSQGGGNPNPEVIRDGDFPPVGTQDSQRQYDTFHHGDQGALDWIGYALPAPRVLRRVVFQEGRHFFDGGWFQSLGVQVGDGTVWSNVSGLTVSPAYPGNNGLTFETFQLDFDPVSATHVRIVGVPGGSARFISVGELRVYALASQPAAPRRFDVRLTVTDPLGASSEATVLVSTDNTPPQVVILSPADGSSYPITVHDQTIPLQAQVTDAEHGPSELACAWRTTLFHDDHSHPEPLDFNCSSTTTITPVGCDGETYWYEISLTVTDGAGLSTTVVSRVAPDCCAGGPPPMAYCTAKTSAAGCVPAIDSVGEPSLSSGAPFLVTCANVPEQRAGVLLYSFAPASTPFLGGTRCIESPFRRTGTQFSAPSAGGPCDGAFAFDFNAWRSSSGDPNFVTGRLVHAQYWFRDPGASFGAGLSDALQFPLCP